MDFAPAPLPSETAAGYRQFGYHTDTSLTALMQRNRDEFGHCPAVFDGDVVLRWADLVDAASRFAGFLHAHGIGPGDVVVWQLPNWWEAVVVAHGIWAAGAVSSPVVPIYREHELRGVIAAVRPAAVVTARSFRGRDHVAMVDAACHDAGVAPVVRVSVRGASAGWTALDDALRAAPHLAPGVDVDAPALVGWTSGTTSGAKGVVHSIRTFLAPSLRSVRAAATTWFDRSYMPAPVAHATGLLSAIAAPLVSGCSTVIRDGWDADRAVDDLRAYGVTFTAGAAVFMQELLLAITARGLDRFPLARGYRAGGSSIPTALAEACDDIGLEPGRAWGMTECPVVTAGVPFLASRRVRCATDGTVVPGCEVRFVAADGTDLPPGQEGEMWVRGPQRALGYLSAEHTRDGFDADGWFRSGDVGIMDGEGAVTVTGRVKDIVNRGGEKLSTREIEEAIGLHPAVREAAVVPAPHERLGEQPAAFVLASSAVTPEELAAYLRALGLAPQKVPQVWRFVDALPRTASGKVTKYVLQQQLATEG